MASIDTTINCAACGKEGGNLNTCNKCNMVKYCNAACKKKHRSKHKKACERRVAELHDEALFKEHPPREECPICFIPLPLDARRTTFQTCCGKLICCGCIAVMNEEARGRGEICLCAFCRTPVALTSAEENIKRTKKLIECNNSHGYHQLAGCYARGIMGMPQDMTKANELLLRAGELGHAGAYCKLGNSYASGRGVEVDKKKAKYYYELAAMAGNVVARHNLGIEEAKAGNIARAMRHFILSANAGWNNSLVAVKNGFMHGIVTKDEYANTLRAYQQQHDEMKNEDRDKAEALRQWIST